MEQFNVPEEKKINIDYENAGHPDSVKTFRPLVYKEGDSYCCALGPNPKQAVIGRGDTVEQALADWNKQLQERIKNPGEDDEVALYICDTLKASVNKVW
jgi:hypothetical protein